jgi:hypothetical protein
MESARHSTNNEPNTHGDPTKIDIFHSSSLVYAAACILTVNRRLLPAEAVSKVEPEKIGGETSPNTLASIRDVGG